jgi:hyperosmotically inducible periplasmic protein
MKKLLTPVVIASVVLLGAVGCEGARTTTEAPSDPNKIGEVPTVEQVQETREDNTSDVRAAQRQSDERARADRAQVGGDGVPTSDGDIESLVRNSLERQFPGAPLAVQSEEGVVTVSGTVPNQQQLAQIQPTTQQVPGVKSVKVNVQVAPPVPANN